MAIDKDKYSAVAARVEEFREEYARLALHLANTFSPAGHEQPMAEEVYGWLVQNGFRAYKQQIVPDRANVVAVLPGTGSGKSLIFNAHMDSEASGPEFDVLMNIPDVNRLGGTREGDRLYGHTLLNDRGAMATFLVTAKAFKESGVRLRGDVMLTAVVGETGRAPVDEYQGLNYEGKGIGTRYLISHGVRADYALVAETTNYSIAWHECGAIYYKLTVRGKDIYTPRLVRTPNFAEHPNAIVRMAEVVDRVEAWGREYEERKSYESSNGLVIPRVNIGAIRGGLPYRPNRSAPVCYVYLDVRIVPGQDPDEVTAELRRALDPLGFPVEVAPYLIRAGIEARGVELLVDAARTAYREIVGGEPPKAPVHVISMWRDIIPFNEAGIPSVTFGPARREEAKTGRLYFEVEDLVRMGKLYAHVALQLCD